MTPAQKKRLSERDICTKFITPAITGGGKWDVMSQVSEEVYLAKGRVVVRGQLTSRGDPKRADYVLSHKPGIPLAIVEAKDNTHTIARLPNGVFAPYTSIKTNLLFFTKGEKTKEVWYYEHPYPSGAKSYNKTKPIALAEFEPERKWWKKRTETPQAWRVPLADIEARGYNLDIKNPNTVDASYRAPAELLAEFQAAQSAAAELQRLLQRAGAPAYAPLQERIQKVASSAGNIGWGFDDYMRGWADELETAFGAAVNAAAR